MVFEAHNPNMSDETARGCCLSATKATHVGLKRGLVCMQQNDSCIILQAFEASKLDIE